VCAWFIELIRLFYFLFRLIILMTTATNTTKLYERIRWALTVPPKTEKREGLTKGKMIELLKNKEKEWGNSMIGQTNNGNWTTLLGEGLVYDVLEHMGQNPKKVIRMNGYEPDWEADNYIYEVKTSNWYVTGTAGEKVLGTFIKYRNIPEIYKKPLRNVCVAMQEYELTEGKTIYFGDNICPKIEKLLTIAKEEWQIEYIPFSQLVKEANIVIPTIEVQSVPTTTTSTPTPISYTPEQLDATQPKDATN